jgi:N,N'-diacetyl-8-epilegionaminate cytidylyltransferase
MKPNVVSFIFARGGSKGLPRKNIRGLRGKPLIAYAIETAQQSEMVDRVIVSTDDMEIAKVAKGYGAEVPFIRPADLADDDSTERSAWQHAIRKMKELEPETVIDVFLSIPATSPLRRAEDVDKCVKTLLADEADIVITVKPAARSPYYNMVVIEDDGFVRLAIPPDGSIHHRQHAPTVYDMTTVAYAARPQYVMETDYIFEGRVKAVVVEEEFGLDIDTELDLQIAELLLGGVDS